MVETLLSVSDFSVQSHYMDLPFGPNTIWLLWPLLLLLQAHESRRRCHSISIRPGQWSLQAQSSETEAGGKVELT